MAEYYPLLAKAVGSLPNSTPESRRVVYERARKALIGQLRTLHPPVPDDDIESESVALDRAIERLEAELATGGIPGAPSAPVAPPKPPDVAKPASSSDAKPPVPKAAQPGKPLPPKSSGTKVSSGVKPPSTGKPSLGEKTAGDPAAPPPLKTKVPKAPVSRDQATTFDAKPAPPSPPARVPITPRAPIAPLPSGRPVPASVPLPAGGSPSPIGTSPSETPTQTAAATQLPTIIETETLPKSVEPPGPPGLPPRLKPPRSDSQKSDSPKSDAQRPIAPQPPVAKGPKRRLWVIPVVVVTVMAAVGFAAWKLRDHPETIAKGKPTEQTQADSGKIAERVGDPTSATTPDDASHQTPAAQPPDTAATANNAPSQQPAAPPNNPDLPVAHRAALLVEAPNEPNKVKTFLGTVVWKLNNVPQGPNDAVGLAVEADIDLPDDKMKAVVTFAKNTEASLPASHTINVRYSVEPGSFTGDVKQISVPQMRPESSPSGEALAGVTVQIVPNSFLVGLSPGNAETANTDLIRRLQWIDIPMLLDSGKIAKLTFEKSDSGQRDLTEALDAWAKQ